MSAQKRRAVMAGVILPGVFPAGSLGYIIANSVIVLGIIISTIPILTYRPAYVAKGGW